MSAETENRPRSKKRGAVFVLMGLSPVALWSVLSTTEGPLPNSELTTVTEPAQLAVAESHADGRVSIELAPSEPAISESGSADQLTDQLTDTTDDDVSLTSAVPDEPQLSPEDAKLAKAIVGNWEQERFGDRLLTVNADGTASMIIKPASLYAFAFGRRIDLNMYWSIKDGHLDYGFKDGTPQDKVDLAAKSWGDHWVEKIERVSETELVLINETDGLPSRWTKAATTTIPEVTGKTSDRNSK